MAFNALKDWNVWWSESGAVKKLSGVERNQTDQLFEFLKIREVKIITGVRRSGKSTLMYQIIGELLARDTKPENLLFINFEDSRLRKQDVGEVFNIYLREVSPAGKIFLFLDEVQHSKDWWFFIRKNYDLKKEISFFVSGSSSELLPKEYSSLLTGRNVSFEVFPLSFREFLKFREFPVEELKLNFITTETENRIRHLLKEYLLYGGFPEVVLKEKNFKNILLNQYFTDIINKDIVNRYNTNFTKTFDLAKYLLTNVSNLFSFRSARAATGLGMETIEKYLSYITESYLVSLVPFFSHSLKIQNQHPKKVYSIDTGLRNAVSFKFSEDVGRVAENLVFIELKRRGKEAYYWKGKQEVDFVIKENLKPARLIQVSWDIENEKTKNREVNALLEGMNEFKLSEGLIITGDYSGEEEISGKTIKYVPLWRWLLD